MDRVMIKRQKTYLRNPVMDRSDLSRDEPSQNQYAELDGETGRNGMTYSSMVRT